jgi:hypothetical protein
MWQTGKAVSHNNRNRRRKQDFVTLLSGSTGIMRGYQTENKEAEKTIRENETTWCKTLGKLEADLPLGEAETRLSPPASIQESIQTPLNQSQKS